MTAATHANLHAATSFALTNAALLLRTGKLVAFPTETVYGLGANALDDKAVASIFEAKGRPRFNPLIVHVRDLAQAEQYAEFNTRARALAEKFWPGPLTLVLPRKADAPLSLLVSAGLDTIALRVPANAIAHHLLWGSGVPIAAPSANASGSVSATTALHVAESLGDKVDLILDGGATGVGIESTIVGFDGEQATLLRPGAIARNAIELLIGELTKPATGTIISPGQLESHYAPRAKLRLDAKSVKNDEALLAFGPATAPGANIVLNLSKRGDLKEAAANLFAMIRQLDSKADAIAVMPIPETGLGEAINDRLRRAAAPRNPP
jgi:L-threonylcarbamoyladenylate synthase